MCMLENRLRKDSILANIGLLEEVLQALEL